MRTTLLLTLSSCVLFLSGCSEGFANDRKLKEITLSGSGYERGVQHGRQLKKEVGQIVELWKENTAKATGTDPNEVLKDFFEYAQFDDAIRKWTPDLYDEVKGIADGSGQIFEEVFVLNLLDEFWVYVDNPENHHCSGVGVPATNGQPAYVGQNMDLERYTDGFQILARIPRQGDRPEQLVLTHAGLIGLNGMNEAGVGICVNTLMQLNASATGLPVAFVVRSLISRTDKADILKFIEEVPHASGQNYIIGVGEEVFDFEASANQVVRFKPTGPLNAVFHTNHAVYNDDFKPWYQNQDAYSENSLARMTAVQKRVTANSFQGGSSLASVFRSRDHAEHPVCRTNQKGNFGFTFASVVMTLGEEPFLKMTLGPPDESEYQAYYFQD
jgi:hypothetical protein